MFSNLQHVEGVGWGQFPRSIGEAFFFVFQAGAGPRARSNWRVMADLMMRTSGAAPEATQESLNSSPNNAGGGDWAVQEKT